MNDDIAAVEGDPNSLPWRNRPGGPPLEWVEVSALKAGDRVMQGFKYLYTVEASAAGENDLWNLVIGGPTVAPTTAPLPPEYERLSSRIPQRRELRLRPDSPYRRVAS